MKEPVVLEKNERPPRNLLELLSMALGAQNIAFEVVECLPTTVSDLLRWALVKSRGAKTLLSGPRRANWGERPTRPISTVPTLVREIFVSLELGCEASYHI